MVRNGCLNYLKRISSIVEKYRVEVLAKVDEEEEICYADSCRMQNINLLYKELQEQIALCLISCGQVAREIFVKPFQGLKNRKSQKNYKYLPQQSKAYSKAFAIFLPAFQLNAIRWICIYSRYWHWLMMEQK